MSSSPQVDEKQPLSANRVAEAAAERLLNASHPALRTLSCSFDQGVLILQGRVSSFYAKQLAQETVARLEGVAQVVNQIEVDR